MARLVFSRRMSRTYLWKWLVEEKLEVKGGGCRYVVISSSPALLPYLTQSTDPSSICDCNGNPITPTTDLYMTYSPS